LQNEKVQDPNEGNVRMPNTGGQSNDSSGKIANKKEFQSTQKGLPRALKNGEPAEVWSSRGAV